MTVPIFLDTGYFIALVNRRDQYHAQAVQLSVGYENSQFLTTDAVLLEVGNALSRSHKSTAIELVSTVMEDASSTIVHLTPEWFGAAFERYRHYADQHWGLVDCFSFVVMQQYGLHQVLTFDQHFAQAGFQILTAKN